MTLSLKTHIKSRTKRSGEEAVVVRLTPYVRLNAGDGPPIFIQNGQFYSEGGGLPIKFADLPEWVGDELARMTPEAKREVGLK